MYSLCAARGINYEPVVFTVQGGMERHTEALLASIAKAVSREEGTCLAEAKSEIIQAITLSLARPSGSLLEVALFVARGNDFGLRRCYVKMLGSDCFYARKFHNL